MLSCKQVSELSARAKCEELSFSDKIKLKYHIMMCKGCQTYHQQIELLQQATAKLLNKPSGNDTLCKEARDRIKQNLKSDKPKD